MVKRHMRHHPYSAADALNSQGLTLEVFRSMNLRRHGKVTIKSIDETRDESEIKSAGHSAQRGIGCRDAVELCFSRGQSRDGNRAAAHLNDIRIHPLFFKKALVLRHKEESRPFIS